METKNTLSLVALTIFSTINLIAQTNFDLQARENNAENPCISESQYQEIENRCKINVALFLKNEVQEKTTVPLSWPLKASDNLLDCDYYYISAHVDHNPAAGAFQDHNCGSIAYDGHKGTDIAIGPFGFLKMDNNSVEVIAAANGTIIDKHDGSFDRNCSGNNQTANYVVLQHSDGSQTYYWHMKSGEVTTKSIGETVVSGEYLGIVGSSGSSGGPHLHFEVRTGNTSATMVDPFSGTCNLINAQSYWASQKPYIEPAVLKASVNTTDVLWPACPATETPNESNSYLIPFQGQGLPAGFAKFYVFLRNETSGTEANMSILNPDGSIFSSWTKSLTSNFKFSYYGFSESLPTIPGTYKFKAEYNSTICEFDFQILGQAGINAIEKNENFDIYPNPSSEEINIQAKNNDLISEISIFDKLGKLVQSYSNLNENTISIYRNNLVSGIYFLQVKTQSGLFEKQMISFVD